MRTILAACLLLALAAPAHAAYNGQFHSNPGLKFGSYNPSFNYGRSVPSPRYQLQMPDPLPGYHYRMKPRRKPWSAP
jgi:hypothetical protein